jgi:hypothetical protein
MTPAENLTGRLRGRWHGRYGEALCPAHEDRRPSLSIRDGQQSVLVKCHAGCTPETVIAVLRRDGLWSDTPGREPVGAKPKHSLEETRSGGNAYRSPERLPSATFGTATFKTSCPVKRASALAAAIHEQRSMMAAFATAGGRS